MGENIINKELQFFITKVTVIGYQIVKLVHFKTNSSYNSRTDRAINDKYTKLIFTSSFCIHNRAPLIFELLIFNADSKNACRRLKSNF